MPLNPDFIPPEIGWPIAGFLCLVLVVIELRARRTQKKERDDVLR